MSSLVARDEEDELGRPSRLQNAVRLALYNAHSLKKTSQDCVKKDRMGHENKRGLVRTLGRSRLSRSCKADSLRAREPPLSSWAFICKGDRFQIRSEMKGKPLFGVGSYCVNGSRLLIAQQQSGQRCNMIKSVCRLGALQTNGAETQSVSRARRVEKKCKMPKE